MQQIKLIIVGKTREKYCQLAEQEFLKRLRRYTSIREEKITAQKPDWQIQSAEAERILKQIEPNEYVIVLDKTGKQMSSEDFAAYLQSLGLKRHSKLCFIIGGPFGLSDSLIKQADFHLSFSPMTFTHEMMRMLFLEQLYRAFTILNNEKYHK
jgi:23S rRNA (pseudouridine1915-N3)-methyltransferase